jgi:hypothetical protein
MGDDMAAFKFRGIDFREAGEYASPRPSISGNNARITVEYLVDWSDHVAAEVALIGKVKCVVGNNNTPYLKRTTPHPHPTYPWLYASEIPAVKGEGTPLGKDGQGVQIYSDARMQVVYSRLRWDIAEDDEIKDGAGVPNEGLLKRYVYREAAKTKEKMITYRMGSWVFIDNNRAYMSDIARAYVVEDLTWVWVQVPFQNLPRKFIAGAGGFCNSTTFDGYGPGKLLVRAMQYEMDGMPDGARTCNAHINATFNPLGWNFFPDPDRGPNQYHEVGALAAGVGSGVIDRPYPQVIEFKELFQPSLDG